MNGELLRWKSRAMLMTKPTNPYKLQKSSEDQLLKPNLWRFLKITSLQFEPLCNSQSIDKPSVSEGTHRVFLAGVEIPVWQVHTGEFLGLYAVPTSLPLPMGRKDEQHGHAETVPA